jgi:hypothetical protein
VAQRVLAGLGLAALVAATALAQAPPEQGCAEQPDATWLCQWVYIVQPGIQDPVDYPVPLEGTTVIQARLHTSDGNNVDWRVVDNTTRERMSETNAPEGNPRATEFGWIVIIVPRPEQVPVIHVEQFMQNDEEFAPINPFMPPLVTNPGTYEFTFHFRPAEGTVVPERAAGGPGDVQLEDAVGDAPSFFDITGAWFDDPFLDDGLIEVGLVVPELASFPEEGAEGYEHGLEWDLLGQRYRVVWGREGAVSPPLFSLTAPSGALFRFEGNTMVRIMDLPATADPANGTMRTPIPLEAIGSPSEGAEFTGMSAYSQRLLARSMPFDPLDMETPVVATEVLDEASTMRRPFALGGPAVWARLRGETPQQPVVVQAPPPQVAPDPWASMAPLAIGGAVVVAGAAAVAAVAARRRAPVEAAPVAQAPEVGAVFLGKYHVERGLGSGAYGSTWLAMHLNLRRAVVIKQLHQEHNQVPEAIEGFRQEARILASLDHPHVTRIHDVELVQRAWYIVMEYVDGGSLEDRLKRGPLAPEEAARITAAILDGLAYIHGRGVLHLDLKPANVLLTSTGIVKIVDFGVSRPAEGAAPEGAASTGTMLYGAPEVLRGEAPDARADLYSVAVTFYELVTGRFYLEADVMDLFEVRRAIASKPPVLPLPHLGARLNAWLDKALAKHPEARFQSARDMGRALQESLSGTMGVQVVHRAHEPGALPPAEAPPAARGEGPAAERRD